MPKIFISYRRADSEFPAHTIYSKLCERFHGDSVFIDVDAIPPGIDFRQHLNEAVKQCDVLLAIIGPHWLNIADNSGNRRLDDPKDFVRIEIEAALGRGIPVIPILLGNTSMPDELQLPATLSQFAYRNGISVSAGKDFDNHVRSLVSRLEKTFGLQEDISESFRSHSREF